LFAAHRQPTSALTRSVDEARTVNNPATQHHSCHTHVLKECLPWHRVRHAPQHDRQNGPLADGVGDFRMLPDELEFVGHVQ
jgi:hypothetical protein